MNEMELRAAEWLANPCEKTLSRYLDTPKFRGNGYRSSATLLLTLGGFAAWWAIADLYAPQLGLGFCVGLSVIWALFVLRSYMIFHDCGHRSFYQGFRGAKAANWATLHLSATLCGTPTDWTVGHQLHHANVGNLGQSDYDWGETIFHTSTQFLQQPKWKQAVWRFFRHPLPFFLMAPVLTWWFRMRLPFELRPGRKAAYRFSDKLLSAFAMFARYKLALLSGAGTVGGLGLFPLVLAGDYLAMFTGVLLFHWQHVYEAGYVRGADEWRIKEASLHGSSFASIPESFKFFTLGIEYHHIHHFRTRMPGYMLREVHESAPKGMWEEVVYLGPADMWRSLFLQVWDVDSRRYASFSDILKAEKKLKAL